MKVRNEFKAALFVIGTLVLFVMSIFVIGRERQLFTPQIEYVSKFTDVKGLNPGAPVRLGGITVGRVSKIDFSSNIADPQIYVTVAINEPFAERIRKDAVATLQTQGLLGDRFLGIEPGSAPAQMNPGETIPVKDVGDISQIGAQVSTVVEDTAAVAKDLREIISSFKTEGFDSVLKAAATLGEIATSIKEKDGVLHSLIYDEKLGKNIAAFGADASAISKELRETKVVNSFNSLAEELRVAASTVKEISLQVKEGPGTMHSFVYGENDEGMDSLFKRLNEISLNLKEASDALKNGTGTLGALLVDPTLYDNLIEITDGARRSFLLRQAIKASLGK